MNTADITCVKISEDFSNSNNKSEWFNRVYLCYENSKLPNTYDAIKGFNCYRYDSFKDANYGFNKNNKLEVRYVMIPLCKWVPEIFDRYILNWKLKKIYWGGQIIMFKKKI